MAHEIRIKEGDDVIEKIISGGQTGADQGALDFAIKAGIEHGGWIPKGRITENGPLAGKYRLKEMPDTSYARRTKKNVLSADGTLIISHGELTGGSALTRMLAITHKHLWLHVNMDQMSVTEAADAIRVWIDANRIAVLNVAGSRASHDGKIYAVTMKILEAVFQRG
jgi:hypothetical protein